MSKRNNKKKPVVMPDGSYVKHGVKQGYIKIPASRNFFGRAVAVVKSSIMHPLTTTVIVESDDEVKTRSI